MQSIAVDRSEAGVDAETVRSRALPRLVLPRFLRRPVRILRRIDWQLPRHFGTKGLIALFLTTAVAGVFAGGHGLTVLSAVTASAGFRIENVKITGQSDTSEVDVLAALDIGTYPSLLTLDLEDARLRIEKLPWVKAATLKKLFPDTVEIAVVEREPYALWQHGGAVSLIDAAGKVITDQIDERYGWLPRVVGNGAAEKAAAYTALIDAYPSIARQAKSGILVSGERWTIVLENGIELMLPADKPEVALATIADLDRDHAILSRDISVIDLREPDRLVVRLTEEGLASRKAMLKERDKAAARGRTNT